MFNTLSFEFPLGSLKAVEYVVDVAIHGGGDITATVANSMVGNSILREVIGANFFTSIA